MGVVVPVAEEVLKDKKKDKIGLIGTRATINSKTYNSEIRKINQEIEIIEKATPLLVPLIEEGYHKRKEAIMILRNYLRLFKEKKVNKLILGCTHYPILQKEIVKIMGKGCAVLDSPDIIARKLNNYLTNHPEIDNIIKKEEQRKYFTTDNINKFKSLGQKFLGESIRGVRKIKLK